MSAHAKPWSLAARKLDRGIDLSKPTKPGKHCKESK